MTFPHALGLNPSIAFVKVTLPVAISFMTFHAISYIVDVHRGRLAASRSPVDILLYISFFPHLVAGPIVRAHEFLPQLASPRNAGDFSFGENMLLILGGLFKKMVIANYLAVRFVDPVFTDPPQFSRFDLIVAVYAYAIQIYADFPPIPTSRSASPRCSAIAFRRISISPIAHSASAISGAVGT